MAKIVSIVDSAEHNEDWDGTLIDVVLEQGDTRVLAVGITYMDTEDELELDLVFDEWLGFAEDGLEGFTVIQRPS